MAGDRRPGHRPAHVPPPLHAALAWMLLAGQGVVVASSVLALRRAGRKGLLRTALSLPFYWPLGAVSALKSLAETAVAPLYWDKTEHGLAPPRSRFRAPWRFGFRSGRPAR